MFALCVGVCVSSANYCVCVCVFFLFLTVCVCVCMSVCWTYILSVCGDYSQEMFESIVESLFLPEPLFTFRPRTFQTHAAAAMRVSHLN